MPSEGPSGDGWQVYNQGYGRTAQMVTSSTQGNVTTTTTSSESLVKTNQGSFLMSAEPPRCAGVVMLKDCPAFTGGKRDGYAR